MSVTTKRQRYENWDYLVEEEDMDQDEAWAVSENCDY